MFEFLNDFGNYESRKIGRFTDDKLDVSTAAVSDGQQPYETAVAHSEYNDGLWIVVEAYDDVESARLGHERWLALMTSDDLPDYLQDCQNSTLSSFLEPDDFRFERRRPS